MQGLASLRIFGVDFFCLGKKFLVFNLVSRNLKIKYRRSILGFFWTLLSPMAMAAIYYFVFKIIMNVQTPHYLAYILSGVLTWSFFAGTLMEGMDSVVGNAGLLTKVPLPLQAFPLVGGVTNLFTYVLSLPIMIAAALISGVELSASLILLPYLFLLLFALVYGLALIMSVAYVFFRDLRHIMGIVIQIWFYATPVIYPESMIPEKYRFIMAVNPLGAIFSSVHDILVDGAWPSPEKLLLASAWTAVSVFGSALFFRRFGNGLVEQL